MKHFNAHYTNSECARMVVGKLLEKKVPEYVAYSIITNLGCPELVRKRIGKKFRKHYDVSKIDYLGVYSGCCNDFACYLQDNGVLDSLGSFLYYFDEACENY